jgi:hypothetical protein
LSFVIVIDSVDSPPRLTITIDVDSLVGLHDRPAAIRRVMMFA